MARMGFNLFRVGDALVQNDAGAKVDG